LKQYLFKIFTQNNIFLGIFTRDGSGRRKLKGSYMEIKSTLDPVRLEGIRSPEEKEAERAEAVQTET